MTAAGAALWGICCGWTAYTAGAVEKRPAVNVKKTTAGERKGLPVEIDARIQKIVSRVAQDSFVKWKPEDGVHIAVAKLPERKVVAMARAGTEMPTERFKLEPAHTVLPVMLAKASEAKLISRADTMKNGHALFNACGSIDKKFAGSVLKDFYGVTAASENKWGSCGFGVYVTPGQMLQAYCSVAAGTFSDGRKIMQNEEMYRQLLQDLQKHTAPRAIAAAAAVPGCRIAARTGMSRKFIPKKGYGKLNVKQIVGFFPADAPEFVVVVVMDGVSGVYQQEVSETFRDTASALLKKDN